MGLDIYHKALHRLYELTDGKGSKAVDFKSLVKQLGFLGHYGDIHEQLSGQGWIVETPKADFVCISHWGVAEVKKTAMPASDTSAKVKEDAEKALTAAKELALLLEKFAQDTSLSNFPSVEKKMDELRSTVSQIKNNLA